MDLSTLIIYLDILLFVIVLGTALYLLVFAVAALVGKSESHPHTGNYNRMAVIKTLNQMLKMNGVDTEIVMKPLNFNDFGADADVKERTEPANVTEKEIDENNVEEKVEE